MSKTKPLDAVVPARLSWSRLALGFLPAWLLATAWGSLVQTQFNLQALVRLGVEIPLQLRALTSAQDLVGFGPVYAGILLATLLPAFGVAMFLARKWPRRRRWLLPLAGGVGFVVAMQVVDAVAPMPVLIDATRGIGGLLAMAAGCAVGGWLFERLTRTDPLALSRPSRLKP